MTKKLFTEHLRLLLVFCAFVTNSGPHRVQEETVDHPHVVATPLGDITGTTMRTRLDKTIYAFRGIRFAKPPIGELRFQPPEPVERWDGVYDATEDGAACPQPSFFKQYGSVAEDCLFVNVYTTKLPQGHKNPNRPVLVYFHPGGYYAVTGASFLAGPKYLLDQDIVLVVPNYRLGSLGFLSTGTKEAPGNNGLKDQVLLLQWVKTNIAAFGGDPNSVTISGYSAGATSVNGHLVSPMSKGLFHRAIMLSGSLYAPWPIPEEQLDLAKKQARLVNCTDDNVADLIKCLKTVPAEALGNSLSGFAEFGNEPVLLWRPVIERDFGQPRFFTEHPVQSALQGRLQDVPVVVGVTAEEFGGKAYYILDNDTLAKEIDEDFDRVGPIALLYERNTDKSKVISRTLRSFYFGDEKIDNSTLLGLRKLFADGIVGYAMNKAAKALAEKNTQPVYYYCFNYTGRASHFYLPGTNNTVPLGAVHHDDLIYVFNSVFFPYFNRTDDEYPVMQKMTTMFGNFVKTGKPIPSPTGQLDDINWTPFTRQHQTYLDIGSKLSIREKLYEERYLVWEKLFPLPNHYNHVKG